MAKETTKSAAAPAKPKAMSKSAIAAHMADKIGITKKQATEFFDEMSQLAYKQAKNSFTLPGFGKLVLQNRAAKTQVMQFGPRKGETIKVPAKKVVKFRVSKAAKDAILGAKK